MIIEDGRGSGQKAHVTDEGCVCTRAVGIHFLQHINEVHQEVYTALVAKTPTAAGDCFLYIMNNSDEDMYISSMTGAAATDETVQLKINDTGTPAGTTENIMVNRHAGSGKLADVTCYEGEDITGLSGGSTVEQFVIDGAIGSQKWRYHSAIIVPKNHVFALYAVTGGIALTISLSIAFHNSP